MPGPRSQDPVQLYLYLVFSETPFTVGDLQIIWRSETEFEASKQLLADGENGWMGTDGKERKRDKLVSNAEMRELVSLQSYS